MKKVLTLIALLLVIILPNNLCAAKYHVPAPVYSSNFNNFVKELIKTQKVLDKQLTPYDLQTEIEHGARYISLVGNTANFHLGFEEKRYTGNIEVKGISYSSGKDLNTIIVTLKVDPMMETFLEYDWGVFRLSIFTTIGLNRQELVKFFEKLESSTNAAISRIKPNQKHVEYKDKFSIYCSANECYVDAEFKINATSIDNDERWPTKLQLILKAHY